MATKLVATLGPASAGCLEDLIRNGVDVFRFNMSHGDHEWHKKVRSDAIAAAAKVGKNVALMLDLQGPKIRVGVFTKPVQLQEGKTFVLDSDASPGTEQRVQFPHRDIMDLIQPDTALLLDDGKVRLRVVEAAHGTGKITCRVEVGGELSSHKGVNLPDTKLPISSMTDKDKRDLLFGLELGFDFVCLSFVQRVSDIEEARHIIGNKAKIVAKIEKPSAVVEIDGIAQAADALMVARGDLGVEIPQWKVPPAQRLIVRTARKYHKPVIIATQMLDSMMAAPIPTRAEVADVAAAAYMGADAVMLSGETASGKYPREAVSFLHRISAEAVADDLFPSSSAQLAAPSMQPRAAGVGGMLQLCEGLPVVVRSHTLGLATELSSRRIRTPLILVTDNPTVAHQACLLWGVVPILRPTLHAATCPRQQQQQQKNQTPPKGQASGSSSTSSSSSSSPPPPPAPASSSSKSRSTCDTASDDDVWQVLAEAGVRSSTVIVVDDTRSPVMAKYLRALSKL